mgnify:CR=1 FL=1
MKWEKQAENQPQKQVNDSAGIFCKKRGNGI